MKSKVTHIISTPSLGGAQILLRDIVRHNKNQYIYCLRKDKTNIFEAQSNVFYYNSYNYYKFNLFILIDICRIVKRYNFEILHLHLGKPLIYACLLKLLNPNLKLVNHEHGEIFLNRFLYTTILRLFQSKIDIFIAVSKLTKQKLSENAGITDNKIKVLYNFVDFKKFHPESVKKNDKTKQREKLGIEKNDFVVGFAGRLVNRKGWMEFVKSAKILSCEKIKLKFLIVGDGPEKQKLIDLINELSLKNYVLYIGYIPDIRLFYSLLDCFIIPSHWEPMGITELEAQAMGIPVIASDVEGLNEIIHDKHNGLLFKSKDEDDLVEKIKLIYNDGKLRKRLIENGFEDIKKYSIYEYLEQLDKIYSNLC